MPVRFSRFPIACLALALTTAGCERIADEPQAEARSDAELPRGSYDFDDETGETRATYRNDDGTTTTMRSGEAVPVDLPAGFELYPAATVTNNTRVEQPDGAMVLLNLESRDEPSALATFYRDQARAAGIDVDLELDTGSMTMIGGQAEDGTSFSFTATRRNGTTQAQLSVGQGLR